MKDIYINSNECLVLNKVFGEDNLISLDTILNKFEEFYFELDGLNEKVEDLEKEMRENYRPISREEELL